MLLSKFPQAPINFIVFSSQREALWWRVTIVPPTPGAGITVVLFSYFNVRNLLIVTGARDTIVAWLPLSPTLHCQAAALSLLISLILCGMSPGRPLLPIHRNAPNLRSSSLTATHAYIEEGQ